MKNSRQRLTHRLTTVGIKILAGVTLGSNLFIGLLLYVNLQSSESISDKVDQVLTIREELSSNLRAAIVDLQNQFLILPEFFQIDPSSEIIQSIGHTYDISEKQIITGRSEYTQHFNRKERRDLAQNKIIVQHDDRQLTVARGIFDNRGTFTDSIEKMILTSSNPERDAAQLQKMIKDISTEAVSGNFLQNKVDELNSIVADITLEAEKTRNEILNQVDAITLLEQALHAARADQKRFTIGTAMAAIIANMIVLSILVRLIVEKPLQNLTNIINEIRSGKTPDVPYKKRTDQIGVLAGAIIHFREALSKIHEENERKEREKVIIKELFTNITSVVDSLGHRSKELVNTADMLGELVTSTENQSESVNQQATETAIHTGRVSESTVRLQIAFQDIHAQITNQSNIVGNILNYNTKSRDHIRSLNQSIKDIHAIITTVSEITDQTKLLALNATIEAARAGDTGKGFAVVASEVKALSLKTENATSDVMHKVKAIEKANGILVDNLQEIDLRMQDLNTLTSNITEAVQMQQHETASISNLAAQTSDNTKNVSTSIGEVSRAATKTRAFVDQVHSSSDEISLQLIRLLDDTTLRLDQLAKRKSSTYLPIKQVSQTTLANMQAEERLATT